MVGTKTAVLQLLKQREEYHMLLRLDKYLADMGAGTRSEVKQYIRKKQVLVNGIFPKGPEQKVDPCKDQVLFQGTPIT